MAPRGDKLHHVRGVINYMGFVSKSTSPQGDKKVASSPELKQFLTYLSEKAPSTMKKVLNSAIRECEKNLGFEKETQSSRKRAAPSSHYEGNSKRHKGSHGESRLEAQTVRQDHTDDDEEGSSKDETPSLKKGSKCSGTALPSKSASDMGERRTETSKKPSEYEIEIGIVNGSPVIKEFVKASLFTLKGSTRASFNIEDEVANIWKIVPHLDFLQNRHELHKHLESREKTTSDNLQARADWNVSEPGEIIEALEKVKRSTVDNKIHRAYGQMMLVTSVDSKAFHGNTTAVTGPCSDFKVILDNIARDRSGPVTSKELDQLISSYIYEYKAGQRWLRIMDWFGGSGIVLIFVIGGTDALLQYTFYSSNLF